MTEKKANSWKLAALIDRGGVYHNVPGANPGELLAEAVNLLPPIASLDTQDLYREILEREALMSTGIGRGIAVPHPRKPLIADASPPSTGSGAEEVEGSEKAEGPLAAIFFPSRPLDWHTPDGSKVHTVFLIVSVSAKQHLETLAKINFLCQQENFYSLIESRSSKEEIITAINEAESSWESTA